MCVGPQVHPADPNATRPTLDDQSQKVQKSLRDYGGMFGRLANGGITKPSFLIPPMSNTNG